MKRQCEESSDSEDNESELRCSDCSKRFKTWKCLKQHMQKHQPKKQCDQCGRMFNFASNLRSHMKHVHGVHSEKLSSSSTTFSCHTCNKSFQRKYHLTRHMACVHQRSTMTQQNFPCRHCDRVFPNYQDLIQHIEHTHPLIQQGGRQTTNPKTLNETKDGGDKNINHRQTKLHSDHNHNNESALQNGVQNRYISPRQNERYDVLIFFGNIRDEIMNFLRSRVQQAGGIKWNLCLHVQMERDDEEHTRMAAPHFRSRTYISLSLDDMNVHDMNEAMQKMYASLEKYMREGSGWYVKEVLKLEVHTVVYRPISGSSFVPLPETLCRNRSVLNIQNQDNKCFLYCILASLHPTDECPEQVAHYRQFQHELEMVDIQYPVTLPQIHKFEKQNDNISVNVFTFEDDCIVPLRVTAHTNRLHHVNLLWLKTEDTSHFCLIMDLNRFLSRTKRHQGKQFFCSYCLHAFTRDDLLAEHRQKCSVHGPQKIELPSEAEGILKFTDYQKTLKVPFVIYADFETINRPIQTCAPNPELSSTTPSTKLEVCSFCYKVVCEDELYTQPTVVYRGPDAGTKLIESLLKEQERIDEILADIKPMKIRQEHQGLIDRATHCCLCKKKFTLYDKTYERIVKHHNHLTGEIIGPACNDCNLKCKQAKFTCVMFHNLKNFDAHILCETLGQFKDRKLTCIAQNSERYVSFSLGKLRFLDSFQFLPSSLETLVSDLRHDGQAAFPHTLSEFESCEQIELVLRKGVYPYDYMDSFERFEERQLPPIEAFYSSLKKEGISDTDYAHAQKVFQEFDMTSLGSYHDMYIQADVLLLADVFEAFRTTSLNQYELDPCHFYTSPGLSWASLLKMTGVQLELIRDIDQMLMIEAGIRGGTSQISKRYKKANNPFVEGFDSTQPTTYIQYLDANNLYGWAMVQPLPVGDFKFLKDIENFDVMTIPEDGEIGYILEVSLHYPKSLHTLHDSFPLAPEQMHISNDQLSPYAQQLLRKLHGLDETDPLPNRGQVGKLMTTFFDKQNYVLHYRNLQLYLNLGLQITAIHRVLQFRQRPWMAPYIEFNTEKRKEATSTFQRNFYKLMNCSCFGKTMENVRKHKNIELVHREERLRKLSAKPTYKHSTIFQEDLVAVELLRLQVKLCKPSYSGMCILDLSKHLIYDFWYNYIKRRYPTAQLLMTDTDSVLYCCQTENIYDDMKLSAHLFDTSSYPTDNPLYSLENKKELGKMKDETNGVPISEFVGLRSKMYSFVCDQTEAKRAKGISKVTVDKELRHEHYKDTLFGETRKMSSMTAIRSHKHELFCETIRKSGLSAFDDKRYLVNSTDSYPYGSCRINSHESSHINRCDEDSQKDSDSMDNCHCFTLDGQSYQTTQDKQFVIEDFTITPCVKL